MLFFSSPSILKFTNTNCRYYSVIESILCFISHHWFCRCILAWKKSQSLKNKEYIDIFVLFFNQLIHFHMQFEFMYGFLQNLFYCFHAIQGRIQDFKLGGAHLKKLRRAEGGAKVFGVFRVKNHDFKPKNHIFPILGGAREIFGVFHVKNHDFTPKKSYFYQF